MESQRLPEELKRYLSFQKISRYQVISHNARKGRWCLRAFTSTGAFLIKWNAGEKEDSKQSLDREKEIYEILREKGITPKLLSADPVLITEYIEGSSTLRKYLLYIRDAKTLDLILGKTLRIYIQMLDELQHSPILREDITLYDQIGRHLSQLMLSGPEGTRIRIGEKIRNKVYRLWMKKCIAAKYFEHDIVPKMKIHGDFHLNNELVTSSQDVFMIDFENIICGNATLELAYWYVQIWTLLWNNQGFIEILDKNIDEIWVDTYFQKSLFRKAVSLYKMGICVNSRFQRFEKGIPVLKRIALWRKEEKALRGLC